MGETDTLEFGVLGPLEVRRGDEALALVGAKQRALLALLLLNANRVVSTDKLIDDLWGEKPPPTAASALQVHVSRLRLVLEPGRDKSASHGVVVTRPPGYVLQAAREQLDLQRFEHLVAEGVASLADGRPDAAATTLREALALWRGPALADLAFEQFAQAPAARLEELRVAALEKRIEADLACGRHAELVGELQELCGEHPLREGLAAHLMLALYRSGRQAEALDTYQRARSRLVDELGIDPGPSLQQLERDILVHDPALALAKTPARLPTGLVTLTFTDIEDSTDLLHRLGDAYATVLADYREAVRDAFGARGGLEVDRQGDGLFYAFPRAGDAVAAAIACQRAIASHEWPESADVHVRIGIHTGAPTLADGGYVGLDVHTAARIGAAAHGGQILVSEKTADAVSRAELADAELRALGSHPLKGLPEPATLFQLVAPGLRADFPPPRTAATPAPAGVQQREVLLLLDDAAGDAIPVSLAEQLALGRVPHELVLASLIDPAAADRLTDVAAALGERRAELEASGITVRVAAFTSSDPAEDVVRLASRPEVDLLLLPATPDVLRDGSIGGLLAAVLRTVVCDVAFVVARDSVDAPRLEGPILVPFGAGDHDWAALELGAWLAGASRPLHLLGTTAETEAGTRDASRLLADAGMLIQRAFGVAPLPRLVGPGREGTVEAAADGGLLVIGLSERWSEEGLGMTRWGIARSAACPIVFVRRGLRPGGLAPEASMTRFTWSVTVGGA